MQKERKEEKREKVSWKQQSAQKSGTFHLADCKSMIGNHWLLTTNFAKEIVKKRNFGMGKILLCLAVKMVGG